MDVILTILAASLLASILLYWNGVDLRFLIIALFFAVPFWPGTLDAARVPSLVEVHRHALQAAGLEPSTVTRWEKRVQWMAAVPQMRVTVQRDLDEQFRFTSKDKISISGGSVTVGPDEHDFVRDYDAGTRIQATAVWYWDRLVFNREALLVSQERRRRHEERLNLIDRVSELYIQWLDAQDRLDKKAQLGQAMQRKLRYALLDRAARLDVLTNGWFLKITQDQEINE